MVHVVGDSLGGVTVLSFFPTPGPTQDLPTLQLKRISSETSSDETQPRPGTSGFCDLPLADAQCPPPNDGIATAVVLVVLVVAYTLLWRWWLWQAQRDHRLLPYNRYK